MADNCTIVSITSATANCVNMSATLYTRRLVELGCSVLGIFLSAIDLSVLIRLQWKRKDRTIDILAVISIISILVLFFYITSAFPDLCWFGMHYVGAFRFWHDFLWMFLLNTFICAYGYMIVMLIVDRYISMHHPSFYRNSFLRRRVRVCCILVSVFIGALCNMKWILLEPYHVPDLHRYEMVWFKILNGVSCIVQYFVCGLLMAWFTYLNRRQSRKLNREMLSDGKLGIIQIAKDGQRGHEIVARMCFIFTVTYILLNWPYAVYDYFSNPEINNDDHYLGALFILINFSQALYLQLNMFIFAYSSRLYRNALVFVLMYPFVSIASCFGYRKPEPSKCQVANEICDYAEIDLFSALYEKTPHQSTLPLN